jgi:CDP-diacylglycerol--glycerol-3-phosphate 3-phosphatidyltransferase
METIFIDRGGPDVYHYVRVLSADRVVHKAMSIYALKPRFQALLRPVAGALYRVGVTANQVTVLACAISVALGLWLTFNAQQSSLFLLIPLWFLLRMALNAIDGMLAREFGQASTLGGYLNELTDVVSDAALYLPFALLPGAGVALVGAVILLSCLTEMAGVLGVAAGASRRYDGPMGKSDRAFVFGALGLLIGCGVAPGAWLGWTLLALSLLLVVTIVNRVRRGIAERAASER